MTAYPDGPLDLRAELLLGSAWTDVTQWAMPDGAQYADITGGTSDGANQPSPATLSTTWDNPDGRFSPRNVSGPWYGLLRRGTMARVSCAAPATYLRIMDSSGGASGGCPAISSGVLDVRLDCDLTDWRAASIAGCGTASGSYSWQIGVDGNGHVVFYFSPDGTNWWSIYLTPEWPKFRQCLRTTYDSSSGLVSFYSAPADSALASATWTSLGSGSLGVTGLHGTAGVYVGAAAGSGGMTGSVWRMSVYQGSTARSFFDATLRPVGATSWTDSLGNAWTVSGNAEISGRDYVLHGELASIVPSVTVPGTQMQAAVQVAGPLRAIQSGSAPPVASPYTRAVLALSGTAAPAAYWPFEDGSGSSSVASGLPGGAPMSASGSPSFAADAAFIASKPLMQLNGAALRGPVPAYADNGALVVRLLVNFGALPTGSGYWVLARIYLTGGTCQVVSLRVYAGGNIGLAGGNASGTVFDMGSVMFNTAGPQLVSIEMTNVSGGVQYMLQTMPPGSPTSWSYSTTVPGAVRGKAFMISVNPGAPGPFTDTGFGQLTVQSAFTSVWNMSQPLSAWAGELAGNRFLRVAAEQGYAPRIAGSPAVTIPMGPQPVDTFSAVLQDIAQADGGLLHEPPGSYSIGYRTLASMYNQAPALTLDYAAGNLPGTAQAADDDVDLVNDWTVSQPNGSSARVWLDDPAVSTSTASAGTYQNTATANTWTADALLDAAGRVLALSAADEARYRQVTADAGIPGTDARSIGAMRIGNLVQLLNPPPALQSGTVRQIVTGQEMILGPRRRATWDCQPASAYDCAVYGDRADTAGSSLAAAVPSGANLLSDGGLESGSAAGWAAANCTAAAVTSPVRSGAYALQITPNGTGSSPRAASPPVPVTAGSTYSAAGWVLASAGLLQPPGLAINWYDGTGAFISSVRATVTPSTTAWTYATVSGAAPAGAVTARATPQVTGTPGAAEIAYWDDMTLAAGTPYAISVASAGVVWTPNAADWPFDIQCGGEQMTVAAVTGTASPQTLTVTRAANGTPAMAHPAGADVRLAKTPRYSAI